ncbi:MAG: TadE family type IV pilus minor pilin [Ilumatobacteraceae bacterium]
MRSPRRSETAPSDDGQATVEFALGLPVVLALLLVAAHLVVVARDQLAVIHAAREGARAAAVASSPATGVAAATAAVGFDVEVSVAEAGDRVRVEVRHRVHNRIPLFGALVPDVTVIGTAVMQVEP